MSSDISSSNNEYVTPYIKINRDQTGFYGASMNSRTPMLKNVVVESKIRNAISQLPQKERPDLSLMQHLVKQDIEFSIPIKKKPPPMHQRQQISYIQPMPAGALKHPQHMSFKRLQPVLPSTAAGGGIRITSTYDVPKSSNGFPSVPDALEALKIPSPSSPSTAFFPAIQPSTNVYPSSKVVYPGAVVYPGNGSPTSMRGSMSPKLFSSAAVNEAPNSRRLSANEPPATKKRARTKNTPMLPATTVPAVVAEIPPPAKKHKPRKSIVSDHSHSSSEPPSAPPPQRSQEKSGTPTLNEDYTVRRSGRKVIKPAHLASADIISSGHIFSTAEKHYYDSTSTVTTAAATTAAVVGTGEDESKNYYECAASLPELMVQLDLTKVDEEIKDRDEVIFTPKDMESISDEDIKKYVLACQEKIKCDAHIAFVHLSSNNFDIKKAMESFDSKDSIPRQHFAGKDSAGIWPSEDLKTFVRLMNNNKCYKRMHKISKHTSNKSTANVVNAYYALKKDVCSFGREFTICPEIIKTQKPALGYSYVDSTKCENCVKQLWNKPAEDAEEEATTYDADILCSLCKFYHILYGKLRPNAESTPPIFDDSSLTHDTCLYEMMNDEFDEKFIPDWNTLKMNVYNIKSSQMKEFAEAIKDLKVDSNTQKLLAESETMNENYTYIFFSEKPLTNIPQFYPKNGIPFVECLSLTDPPATSNAKESTPPPPAAETTESDDENDGPPILINEMERNNIKTKTIIEKPFDVFYFGYLDGSSNELHNEHGIEFHHAYLEKLQSFDDSVYLSFMSKQKEEGAEEMDEYKPSGLDDDNEKDKADKEMIAKYGNISFSTFSQTFIDSKKKFQTASEALNVPLEYLEAYVRQNYYNLKIYFAQYERMVKTRARRAKGRSRAVDEREKRPNHFSFDVKAPPQKRQNYFLAL